MGLPTININFIAQGNTAVVRSGNGVVAVILADDSKSGDEYTSYIYKYETDIVKAHWTSKNQEYLSLIFAGSPSKVLVERVAADVTDYTDALARLAVKKWNWLTIPGISDTDTATIEKWITAQRTAKKGFKAVLTCEDSPNEPGIVNFATDNVVCGGTTYSAAEFCARIAGLLAGTPLSRSATYSVLTDVTSIAESTTPDDDVDDGKFILINDGENIKVGRAVNSLVKLGDNQIEDMKSIKIIEAMDLIREDITTTFADEYVGKYPNTFDYKTIFCNAVNAYFGTLESEGVLYSGFENTAYVDADAQADYLTSNGKDISDMTDTEILEANTGTQMFIAADVQFANAVEDLTFNINLN